MGILRRLLGVQKKAPKGRVEYLKDVARKRASGQDKDLSPNDPQLLKAVSELQDYIDYKDIRAFEKELQALIEGRV